MAVDGEQLQAVHDSILDSFQLAELQQLVRYKLDVDLSAVAGGANSSEIVFNLIDWAYREGRLGELIESAAESKPKNARLAALRADALGWFMPAAFDWVAIPSGDFLMGSDAQVDAMADADESPQHRVYLPGYSISRFAVTNEQYARFVQAKAYQPPSHWQEGKVPRGKDEHPVVNVSWQDAQAFCRWAGVRLPNEAEWEKAARGTDGRLWPWGNQPPTGKLCNYNNICGDTTPIGAYKEGASPFGLLDMSGNVWEWTSSLYRKYPYDPNDGRERPTTQSARVLRGGSFLRPPEDVRCATRVKGSPREPRNSRGFRIVLVA